jgi:release factor glutamine methyltransferase
MTSAELLQKTAKRLKRHGIEDPQIEARILLGHAVELSAEQLLACLDMHPTQSHVEKLEQFIIRRISHEPIAYIIQHKDFYGLSYYVDHRVLIPRPETELLVEKAIDFAQNKQHNYDLKIADIGTGSGAIAISLAIHLAKSAIFAIDISPTALEVASINCQKHNIRKQITFLHGDLLNPLPVSVDMIVANLPYIAESEMKNLPPEIRDFEPITALHGGDDGLHYIEMLLQQAISKINPDGCILLEIGLGQRPMMANITKRYFPNAAVTFFKDLGGIDRVIQIKLIKSTYR